MKEILGTILSAGKKVAATQGNQNVPISHARFAESLDGDEDILIIEYGEGAPGDVVRFARNTHPDIGIITGVAPAHLDRYGTLEEAGVDIFSLADYLGGNEVYVNGESENVKTHLQPQYHMYDSAGVLGWQVTDIKNGLSGLNFVIKKGSKTLNIRTKLLGRHLIGTVALAVALADKYGVAAKAIEEAAAKLKPFEHRMQPYPLADAWVIDDTYNGNIEGMRAGLALLTELPARRKVYVTPGLVDQGEETEAVHKELGRLIGMTAPDKVVLIKHSVTKFIQEGLAKENFKGELIIEEHPLEFYSNLDQTVAAGDLVMMQNDWPDNYN
jgi:UDP-N-acetylmuramoyl-tripeptide--D-alanyl-D-alanine ligase